MPAIRSTSPNSGPSGLNLASAPGPTPARTRQKYIRLPGKTLRDPLRKAYEDSADPEARNFLHLEGSRTYYATVRIKSRPQHRANTCRSTPTAADFEGP